MDLSNVKEKAAGFLHEVKGGFANLLPKASSKAKGQDDDVEETDYQSNKTKQLFGLPVPGKILTFLTAKMNALGNRFLGNIPEKKRRPIQYGICGLVIVFVILVIAALLNAANSGKGASAGAAAGPRIPSEELFIPSEPDFIPKFLLEREPRLSWSVEDIRPYWKNPADTGLWQGVIKSEVDKLMEGVP